MENNLELSEMKQFTNTRNVEDNLEMRQFKKTRYVRKQFRNVRNETIYEH